jgi:hypothetical protein
VARVHEDRLGAPAQRLGGAHRRTDAEPARDVVRRGHHTPALRVAADNQRPVAKRRVFQLLDGREEGVEIEVSEDP